MQTHNLKNKKKKSKRIGRGGKRGTYSGKGQKGQKSRSGHVLPKSSSAIILKLPKRRGLKNRPLKEKPLILNLDVLPKLAENKTINKDILVKKGIIKNKKVTVKILGDGVINLPLIIEGLPLSKSAKEKIEGADGSVL